MKRRAVVVVGLAAVLTAAYTSSAVGGAKQSARSASVGMKEFRFTMPSNLRAGRTTFTFRNTGQFPHNFTIVYTSRNGTRFRSPDVAGGQSRRQTVSLRPGAYVAVCTVFNGFHVSRGMMRRFTVGTFDQQEGRWQ
jgi:plastocyanin